MDDIRAAIDYLTTLPYVDKERIGAMGVCAGGGYTMSAVQTEMRIKAAAGVCAWNVGTWIRDGLPFKGKNAAMADALKAAAAPVQPKPMAESPSTWAMCPILRQSSRTQHQPS